MLTVSPDSVQACLLGEEDVQGILVMCTYLTRLLSNISSNRILFSYVPEVRFQAAPLLHLLVLCLSVITHCTQPGCPVLDFRSPLCHRPVDGLCL